MNALTRKIHLINFSRKLIVNTVFFLIPLYFLTIGFKGWQIGLIVSIFGLTPLLFSFPVGWLNDRVSIKRIVQAAMLALSLIFLVMGWIRSFPLMAVLFLFLGVSNNALDVSLNSMYYKDETQMDLNKKYSQLAFWLALGTAVGTLVGGFLTHFFNFQTLFYVYSLFILLVLFGVGDLGRVMFSRVSIKEYRLGLLNRKTMLFALIIFVLTLHWGAEGTVYSPFLKNYFDLNNFQLSLYISIPLFALAFSSFLVGVRKFDAGKNRRMFIFSMFLSGMGHVLMVNKNVYLSFIFRIIHEVGDGLLGALIVLFISRLFEKRSIGGSSGVLLAIMTLGHMAGALVFSLLGYRIGLQYPFVISGALLIANSAFGYCVFRKIQY